MPAGRERGQALLLITMSIVLMCGLLGLAADLGWMHYIKKSAQASTDAAALASVQQVLDTVGQAGPFTCGTSLTCQDTAACASPPANPPVSNLDNGCLYAQRNGFEKGGDGGRQNVTITAGTVSPPPTAPGVNADYWVTVRAFERVPTLFSSALGYAAGGVAARSTAAIVDIVVDGRIYALDRKNDPSPNGAGNDIFVQGNSTVDARDGGIYMASTSNGGVGGSYAGHAGGTASVRGSFIAIRGAGAVDNPGNFVPTAQDGFPDGTNFKDPMRGKSQPPAPQGLPEVQVPGGSISGDCHNPTVLNPASYYAVGPQPGCKQNCPPVATGQPIQFTGCVTLSGGTSGFGNYVFFGGASFSSPGTKVTFSPGRYLYAGALAGNSIFSQTNGVSLQDSTPLDSTGNSTPNVDAGEIFVFTDTNYPGLQVPTMVQSIGSQLQFGGIDIQMGNNAGSLMNLHGLNPDAAALPRELKTFAPTVFWQDQRNAKVSYLSDGNIDTTSCGPGHDLDSPCPNNSTKTAPEMHLQAHPNLHLYGVLYQPRGASLTLQGNGNIVSPTMIITGAMSLQGGPDITLQPMTRKLLRKTVALVE